MILPRNSSPTGTPALLPVLVTFVPSFIPVSFPNRIHPISVLLISCTIPLIPFSNTTISPYMALSIPYIVTIPSPTQMTVPTSLSRVSKSKFSISLFSMEIISPELIELKSYHLVTNLCVSRLHLPARLQSYSLFPTLIIKPPIRLSFFSNVSSTSEVLYSFFRKSSIPFFCVSVGGVT